MQHKYCDICPEVAVVEMGYQIGVIQSGPRITQTRLPP